MGCDYYIIKQLEVKYINDDDNEMNTTIESNRERCYFPDLADSQDSDDSTSSESYNSRFNRKYGKYLNVTYQPRVLFNNGKWKSERVRKKYENLIISEIGSDLLLHIVKQEVRYLR
jgi:hypothetical protein